VSPIGERIVLVSDETHKRKTRPKGGSSTAGPGPRRRGDRRYLLLNSAELEEAMRRRGMRKPVAAELEMDVVRGGIL
jgi:hypothetical protein